MNGSAVAGELAASVAERDRHFSDGGARWCGGANDDLSVLSRSRRTIRWSLDVTYREDALQTRHRNLAAAIHFVTYQATHRHAKPRHETPHVRLE